MTAVLDYNLKTALKFMTKDNRWNVLTVLILHANIRNRSWPSIETMSEMAANGNRTKANRAKLWLEKHRAFELVAFDKRVGKQEQDLPARLHVYQLTGIIQCCDDKACDCGGTSEIIKYLHFNSPDGQTIRDVDSPDGGTNEYANSLNGKTVDSPNGHTINSPNGGTGSISIEEYPLEVIKTVAPNGAVNRKSRKAVVTSEQNENPEHNAIVALIRAWKDASGSAKSPFGNTTIRGEALELHHRGVTPQDVIDFVTHLRQNDKFWKSKEIHWSKVAGEIIPSLVSRGQSHRLKLPNLSNQAAVKPALVADPEYVGVFPKPMSELGKPPITPAKADDLEDAS